MVRCINISHPEFKSLLEQSSSESFELELDIASWQEFKDTDKFPSLTELNNFSKEFNTVDVENLLLENDAFQRYTDEGGTQRVFVKARNTAYAEALSYVSKIKKQFPQLKDRIDLERANNFGKGGRQIWYANISSPIQNNSNENNSTEISESEITYTDENGNPCAVKGLTNTTKGTNWKIVKDFKGMPKHSQGGVDITISDKGVNIRRGGKDIKAAHGLLIAATGLVIPPDPKNKPKTDPIKDNDDKIYESGVTLKEVVTTAEAPEWLKYREEYVKNNPFNIDEYVENRFNTPIGREAIKKIDGESWKKELKQEGLERRYNAAMDYTGEALVRNKPQGELSRAEWLNQMSDGEEEIIKRNPKYQSSLWADAKIGLTSLVAEVKDPKGNSSRSVQAFSNILNSSDFSNREKREILKDYAEHPVMSKLGDAGKILSALTVGPKVVQSFYRDETTLEDALQGKKNKAGMLEDIVTDPLNLIGLGIWGKLSQTGKFAKIGDVYKAVSNLPGAEKLAAIQKFLGTEEGLLSNMYKYNSFANKEVPMNKLFHGSNNPNLSLDDIKFTEFNPNVGPRPGQFKRRAIKSGDPLEMPGGFYTNDRSVPKFMGNAPYRYSMDIPANSKVFKWESGSSDNISVKKLQELKNKGYDVIQGKNILGETEYIPLNKDLINNWKMYQKEAPELELLKDSNFETITPNWLKGYPKVPKQLPGSPNAVSSVDDVGKEFGISIDDLGTNGIIKKSKDVGKNVDLGIGKYDHTNLVEYKNGLQLHTYSKPGSEIDDVILVYNPKTSENIAYMRNYKIGDDWKPTATNAWHIKADMPTSDKDLIKFANQELEKIVQVKPIKFEGKTISTDGLRYWDQQQKHGYSTLDNFNKPYVSAAGKDDLFKGIKYSKTDDAFDHVRFETKKDAIEGASRLENFIKSQGLDYKVIINNDNTLQINLPELQRAFSIGGSIGGSLGYLKANND